MGWHVGMQVVCVEAITAKGYGDEHLPQVGSTYTIRKMSIDDFTGMACIWLVELVNEERKYEHRITGNSFIVEPAFHCFYFRPVETRQTDISCFTQMLNPSKVNVGEPA